MSEESIAILAASNNLKGRQALMEDVQSADRSIILDAYVTEIHRDYHDRYKISLYTGGYGQPPTLKGAEAVSFNPMSTFDLWSPARAIRAKSGLFFLVRPSHYMQYLLIKEPFNPPAEGEELTEPDRLTGWPCNQDGETDSLINLDEQLIHINNVLPESGMEGAIAYAEGDVVPWIQYDTPKTVAESGSGEDLIPEYRTLGVLMAGSGKGGGSAKRFKVVTAGLLSCEAKTWDGSTLGADAITIITTQGHGVDDIIYAVKSQNGTENVFSSWVEVPRWPASTSRWKVVQVVDTVGRLGLDYVRAH